MTDICYKLTDIYQVCMRVVTFRTSIIIEIVTFTCT